MNTENDEFVRIEREACAKVVEDLRGQCWAYDHDQIAAAIRARVAIADIKEVLAQPEQEPVGKLQEATAERGWFKIAVYNAWAEKKLSENPHWVMPKDEPERDEPQPKRPWVGLTDEERASFKAAIPKTQEEWDKLFNGLEAKLKEKNA